MTDTQREKHVAALESIRQECALLHYGSVLKVLELVNRLRDTPPYCEKCVCCGELLDSGPWPVRESRDLHHPSNMRRVTCGCTSDAEAVFETRDFGDLLDSRGQVLRDGQCQWAAMVPDM